MNLQAFVPLWQSAKEVAYETIFIENGNDGFYCSIRNFRCTNGVGRFSIIGKARTGRPLFGAIGPHESTAQERDRAGQDSRRSGTHRAKGTDRLLREFWLP